MNINRKNSILSFSFCVRIGFFTPIFATFLSNIHGFSTSQITMIFAIFSITTFIFEIPTGIAGDIFGEKMSLISGSMLLVLSTMLFLSNSIYLVFLAEIILAISATFMSGSFESLIYKYSNDSENDIDCDRFISRAYSLQWMALCLSFLGCFVLMRFVNLSTLFLLTLLFNILALISSLMLPKTKITGRSNGFMILKKCLKEVVKKKNVRVIFFL